MPPVTLDEQERLAINQFLSENWEDFKAFAENFLDEAEIEALDRKLEGHN